MRSDLPAPGYYTSHGKDVIVLDPLTVSDTGEVVTKDGDDARWQPAVTFRKAFAPGSPTYVLSAAVFDGRFEPTTREEALKRVQDAERQASLVAATAAREAEESGESKDAEGITSGASA